jgi:uncharacterized cysteine cluster protein YcgN (CxxCxxCC family)
MTDDSGKPASRSRRFWESKTLAEMTKTEWEALCDGCGLCCLAKLEDEQTGEVLYTSVACRLLDLDRCRCTQYRRRTALVPDCVELTPRNIEQLKWMPATCAYRRLHEGKPLPDWHPLRTGDPESVHRAGISVRDKAVSENDVHPADLEALPRTRRS